MKQEKWKSLLGLANRAGKIASGEEQVLKEIRKRKAKLVILAGDASENTAKKFQDKCSYYQIPLKTAPDRFSLGSALGKPERVVVAVLDEGFANGLMAFLN